MSELKEYVLDKTSVINKNIVETLDNEGSDKKVETVLVTTTNVNATEIYYTKEDMDFGITINDLTERPIPLNTLVVFHDCNPNQPTYTNLLLIKTSTDEVMGRTDIYKVTKD